MSHVISNANIIGDIYKHSSNPVTKLSEDQMFNFRTTSNCESCDCEFTMLNTVVRDHCHITSKFRSEFM